ncbi:hypothetical protein BH24ACI3_BH24ACI3_01020 [soil metagenome]
MKKLFLPLCILVFAAFASGQNVPVGFDVSNYGVRIEPDKRVMIVLAAIETARTVNDAGESVPVINTPLSAAGSQFRELLKSDLAATKDDIRDRIASFIVRHKRARPNETDAQIIAPFISMAYALTPAPELADPVITSDLPGNLLDVLDFAPLVRDFYRSSSISGNLDDYVKRYRTAANGRLRSSTNEMVSDILLYLKTRPQLFVEERVTTETQRTGSKSTLKQVERRTRERKFTIVPEMLAPVGTITYVNVKDEYFVVLPPDTDVSFSEVRRGFLQFVIDPLILKHSRDINTIRESVKGLIDEKRKTNKNVSPDVYLTISRSLVAAIDAKQLEVERVQIATAQARQRIGQVPTEKEKLAVSAELANAKRAFADETALRLSEDYENGALLVFYFSEQLRGIEDSGFDIAASMAQMILSFDATKERDRLPQYSEARKRAQAARAERRTAPASTFVENPVTSRLLEIQEAIKAKNYGQADAQLKELLSAHPGEPRIFYNIGRVASLSAESVTDEEELKLKLLESKVAYENVIRIAEKQLADTAAGIQVTKPVDPALVSISYVSLGKIYEFYGEVGYAMSIYEKAIALGNVTGGSFNEAIAAKQRLMRSQQ